MHCMSWVMEYEDGEEDEAARGSRLLRHDNQHDLQSRLLLRPWFAP